MKQPHTDSFPNLVFPWEGGDAPEDLVSREWLVTNGLGGYASGTSGAWRRETSRTVRARSGCAAGAHDDGAAGGRRSRNRRPMDSPKRC